MITNLKFLTKEFHGHDLHLTEITSLTVQDVCVRVFNNPCQIEMIGNFTMEIESCVCVCVRWSWAELISIKEKDRAEITEAAVCTY